MTYILFDGVNNLSNLTTFNIEMEKNILRDPKKQGIHLPVGF